MKYEKVTKKLYLEYAMKYFGVYYSNYHKSLEHFIADLERCVPRNMLIHYFDVIVIPDGTIHEIVNIEKETDRLVANEVFRSLDDGQIVHSVIMEKLEKKGIAEIVDDEWRIMVRVL